MPSRWRGPTDRGPVSTQWRRWQYRKDLALALAARPGARDHFDAYSPSARKGVLGWIALAKRPETRARRVSLAADVAERGDRPATLWQRVD